MNYLVKKMPIIIQILLLLQAKPLLKKNNVRELVDPSLGDDYNNRQLNLMLLAASLCIQQSSIRRPSMSQVAIKTKFNKTLENLEACLTCPALF